MTTDMTNRENLIAAVRETGADGLTIWGLYTFDVYESAFGDGYWPSLSRLFLKEETARRWGDWIRDFSARSSQMGYGTEIRKMRLVLDGETLNLTGPVGEWNEAFVHLSGLEKILPEFSGTSDWHATLEWCKRLYPEASPPEEEEAGNDNEKV